MWLVLDRCSRSPSGSSSTELPSLASTRAPCRSRASDGEGVDLVLARRGRGRLRELCPRAMVLALCEEQAMAMALVSSSLLREVRSKANFVVARQQSRRPRNRFRLIARSATKHTSSSRERSRWRCTRSSARSATTRILSSLRSPARHASNGACGDIAQHNGRPRRPPRQYRPISNGDSGAIALPWSSSSPGG